jgi:hypothetical protein
MPTIDTKRKLVAAGMFALPLALVWGTGVMFGGPTSAKGATAVPIAAAAPTSMPLDTGVPAPTETEAAAASHIAALEGQPFGSTPLFHPRKGVSAVVVVTETPGVAPVPVFTVKAILASARGNTALIDGASYRVGDELTGTGWTITRIDADTRSVTIEDPETKRTAQGFVELPH